MLIILLMTDDHGHDDDDGDSYSDCDGGGFNLMMRDMVMIT